MQDSVSISTIPKNANLDTVNPIYIFKDSTVLSADADMDYGFIEYTTQTLNEVLPKPILEESLLKEKTYYLHKPLKLQEKETLQYTQTWTFSIIVLFFAVLAIWIKFFRNRFLDIIHSCLSLKSFEMLTKSSNPLITSSSLLFFPITTLLIYSSAIYWFPQEINQFGRLKFYAIALGALVVFFLVKMLLIKFFGLLFRSKQQVNAYITNILVYMSFNSILIILPVFASLFTSEYYKFTLLIISLSLFALFTVIRTLRGLFIIIKFPKFFNVYLFCYLCTLEILPLLLIYRLIS
jgi:hypothetical protein